MDSDVPGWFASGLPYNRFGTGGRRVIVFPGLFPDNRPLTGIGRLLLVPFGFLRQGHDVWVVTRRQGLAEGATLEDMADDYATVVERDLGGPIDVIGMSTGGSIAQVFAVRRPDLVRRLVLWSSAYTLGAEGRGFQRRVAALATAGRWADVGAETLAFLYLPRPGVRRRVVGPAIHLAGRLWGRAPANPRDFVVTIDAEDSFDFRHRLPEIAAPTLVIGGDRDPFYPGPLFRSTAAGIPGARLLLLPGAGHAPGGRRVAREILAFLDGRGAVDGRVSTS